MTSIPSCTSALGLSQSSVMKDVLLDVILRHCSSVVCHPTLKPFLALAALLSNLDRYLRLGAVEFERHEKSLQPDSQVSPLKVT